MAFRLSVLNVVRHVQQQPEAVAFKQKKQQKKPQL